MHAHHDDVDDPALLEKVEQLLAVVGQRVVGGDVDQRCLSRPRAARFRKSLVNFSDSLGDRVAISGGPAQRFEIPSALSLGQAGAPASLP
jgi:hypothetical protein